MPIRSAEPSAEARKTIQETKDVFAAVEATILATIPNSRERALALTNLEQASMWATKALCETGPIPPCNLHCQGGGHDIDCARAPRV